jgi:hypothetical protein
LNNDIDLDGLRALGSLRVLSVTGSTSHRVRLDTWLAIPTLRALSIRYAQMQFPNFIDDALSGLDRVHFARVHTLPKVTNGLPVSEVAIADAPNVSSLAALAGIRQLTKLVIENCPRFTDASVLPTWSLTLREVHIIACGITRLRSFTKLEALNSLVLRAASPETTIGLRELSELRHIITLTMLDYQNIDLRPLADIQGMAINITPDTKLIGVESLSDAHINIVRVPKQRTQGRALVRVEW